MIIDIGRSRFICRYLDIIHIIHFFYLALRDLSTMQMDGYKSDDDYEVDEDRISAQEEVERAKVDSQKLEEELLHAERTPTPGCNVTRLPCAAHKVFI